MNILLAGVAGFIGSNLALYFLKKNYCVIGIDNFITGDKDFKDVKVDRLEIMTASEFLEKY